MLDEQSQSTAQKIDPTARKLGSGGRALLLLADPINISILCLLAREPRNGGELGRRLTNVSRSTRFERLRELEGLGVIVREKRGGVPPVTVCRLAAAGVQLLPVAASLEAWLSAAPTAPLTLGDPAATATIKALSLGWGSTVLRWLADEPRSLSELEPLVATVGYRELERILRNLIEVGLAERAAGRQRLRPYTATRWARESVVPLTASVYWEQHHIPQQGAPVTALDAESGFWLALPLVELSADLDGACRLIVDIEAPGHERIGEVSAQVVDGRLVSGVKQAEAAQQEVRWVRGSMSTWVEAVIQGCPTKLQAGCDAEFPGELIAGLRQAVLSLSALSPAVGRLFELS